MTCPICYRAAEQMNPAPAAILASDGICGDCLDHLTVSSVEPYEFYILESVARALEAAAILRKVAS